MAKKNGGPTKRTATKKNKLNGDKTTEQTTTVVDLTDPLDHLLPSPSTSSISDTPVGLLTVGAPTKKSGKGRPKDSPVWNFFRYDEVSDKSICLVEKCTSSLSGCNTGNNRSHLLIHPKSNEEYLSLIRKQKAEKEEKKPSSINQITLDQMALAKKPYDADHPR